MTDQGAPGLVRSGVFALVGVLAQGLTRFVTALLIGHTAGPASLGHVTSALSLGNLLAFTGPSTAGSAAAKFVSRAEGAGNSERAGATTSFIRSRVLVAAGVLSLVGAAAWVLWQGGDWTGAVLVGALTAGLCLYPLARGTLLAHRQVRRSSLLDCVSAVVGIGGVGLLLAAGVDGLALLLPLAAGAAVFVAAAWPRGSGRVGRPDRREIDMFVLLGAIGTLCSAGFLQLSVLVARTAEGSFGAGQFSSALALATPAAIAANSLGIVLFPEMARAHGRGDLRGVAEHGERATTGLLLLLVPVVGAVALASPLIVQMVWGAEFAGAAPLLPILLVGVLATAVATPSVNAITSGDQSGLRFTTAAGLVGVVVGVATWLLLVDDLGLVGVALGHAVGTSSAATAAVVMAGRRAGLRGNGMWSRTLLVGAAVLVACLAPVVWQAPWPWQLLKVFVLCATWWVLNRRRFALLLQRVNPSAIPGRRA